MTSVLTGPTNPDARVVADPPPRNHLPGFARHPLGRALASAALLWLAFPPAGWHGAAWVALVPLFLMVADPRPRKILPLAAWVSGFAFWLLAVQWVMATDPSAWVGWLAMGLALSGFWVAFVVATRSILRRTGLPITLIAPVVWVGLEYLRAHVLTGFPWYYLAHTQYRQIYWTQIGDFAGSLGLSFLIALVNAVIAEGLSPSFDPPDRLDPASHGSRLTTAYWVRLGLVAASALGTLGYGVYRVESASFRDGPRVALLQSNEVQHYNPEQRKSSHTLHQLYLQMVENAAKGQPKPDLIVWPETAFPYGLFAIDPDLTPSALDEQAKLYGTDFIGADIQLRREKNDAELRRMIERYRIPMMIGVTTYDFRASGYSRYNSAVLFRPGASPQSYHKLHLVPFGEYVPLIKAIPWLIKLTPFTPDQMPTLCFGESPTWFDLGVYRLAAAICFEDTVPHVVRRFFAEVPDAAQPDLIVNLSNDGWFHETVEHEMHLAVSTFRCIENRAPMARAVNTGISAMIDGNGRIVAALDKNKQGVLIAVTPQDDRTSLYSRWGDWLGQGTLVGTVGFLILGMIVSHRPRTPPPTEP